jgi:hypothetical protein
MTSTRPLSLVMVGTVLFAASVCAQFAGPQTFDLTWNTIDDGGGTSSGGTFTMTATIGQPDTGVTMTGGPFEFVGGFWPGVSVDSCPPDITGDLIVDVDDLLYVINSWGLCDNPQDCPADIAPPGQGNGVVNVDDLLAVVNGWGGCD